MKMRLTTWLLAFGLLGALTALPTMAQQDNGGGGNGGAATDNGGGGNNNNGGGGGNRRGGGPGGGNFQQWQAQRMQRIKDAMQASDDDWKALEPKIQAVQQLQMQQMMGRMGRRGGGGPGGNQDPNAPTNPVAQAQRDLQSTLDNKDATPDQIKTKLQALRDARKKAADDLKKSQDDLRDLLTVRQEAVLVTQGILD